MSAADRLTRYLGATWWFLFPAFGILLVVFTTERACHDPHYLLPKVAARTWTAWCLALVYLAAQIWGVVAYVTSVQRTGRLLPSLAGLRSLWGRDVGKVLLMWVLLALEYSPIPLWRAVGSQFHCQ